MRVIKRDNSTSGTEGGEIMANKGNFAFFSFGRFSLHMRKIGCTCSLPRHDVISTIVLHPFPKNSFQYYDHGFCNSLAAIYNANFDWGFPVSLPNGISLRPTALAGW